MIEFLVEQVFENCSSAHINGDRNNQALDDPTMNLDQYMRGNNCFKSYNTPPNLMQLLVRIVIHIIHIDHLLSEAKPSMLRLL